MHRRTLLSIIVVVSALGTSLAAQAQSTIVVGGKAFTEQILMTEMTVQLLEAKGYKPDRKAGMGSAALRAAHESGQIDVYWEYTGTSLVTYNKVSDKFNAADTYKKVKELDAAKGIVWRNPSAANNTYALAMRRDDATKRGIASLSDLARAVKADAKLSLASNSEFYARPDGLKPLQETYGFEFARDNVKRMDTGLTYQALRDSQVDVAVVFATDGRVPAFNFVVLRDDKGFFPAYALTPVVRKEVLDKNPRLVEPLNALAAKLNDANVSRMNASIDVDKKSVEDVARSFLKENGLL
ncbi:MAG: glycine betaine ABC transporter substrate-binding protein [Rhodoferax sp.]|nr:glycine betaine ABC transporter substrate-binding protein [Rhodoferax sp.]